MNQSPRKQLYLLALKCLTRREHSVFELTQKLREKTEHPEFVPDVIKELIQKKYLDDTRFAEMFMRARATKGYGPLRIKRELKEKGITENIALIGADIKMIYERKFGHAPVKDIREKAKQIRYLQYRGFSFDEIKKVLNHEDDE